MEFFATPETMPAYKQFGWEASQRGDIPFLGLMIAFSTFMFLLELMLEFRQYEKFEVALKKKNIPKELKGIISEEVFTRANDYGVDKFKFSILESIILFVEGLLLIFQGYLPWAWDSAATLAIYAGVITDDTSALFTETFVVEQNHGFNKSTVGLFFYDKAIGFGLTVALGFPVVAMIVGIVRWGGEYFYFYVWSFLFMISILMLTIYPTLIAPLFNKYTKLDKGPIFDGISKLAKDVSFPLSMIFLVDGSKRSAHSNAYFYGFFKNKRIVMFDTLINQVELPELLAILGHEIGHWQLSHALQGFVVMQNSPGLFAAFGFNSSAPTMPVLVGLVLFSQTIWSPVDKMLNFLMNFNSRCNEFAADRYAVKLGMGEALGRGLVKISTENLGNMVPDPWYSMYHFSHPSLVERLRELKFKQEPAAAEAVKAAVGDVVKEVEEPKKDK